MKAPRHDPAGSSAANVDGTTSGGTRASDAPPAPEAPAPVQERETPSEETPSGETQPEEAQPEESPGAKPKRKRQHRHFLVWKIAARARLETLEDEVKIAEQRASEESLLHLVAAKERLNEALVICQPDAGIVDRLAGVIEWYTGAAQERAWSAIHQADAQLSYVRTDAAVRAERPNLKQTIRERVSSSMDRKQLEDALTHAIPGEGEIKDRDAISSLKQLLYKLSDEAYEEKRSFRNIVMFTTVLVATVDGLLAVPGWFGDDLFKPLLKLKNVQAPPLWQVELVGAIAGLIVAIVALNKLAGLRGPYSLQFVQATLKIPMGALTGLIGAVLVRSGELTIGPATTPVVLFTWVFVFGAAQQLVTRFVDKKAATVLDDAKPGVSQVPPD